MFNLRSITKLSAILIMSMVLIGLHHVFALSDTPDLTFNPNPNGVVTKVLRLNDGKYMIGGAFTKLGTSFNYRVSRLNADGSEDTSFNTSVSTNGQVNDIIALSNGKYMIVGTFTSVAGVARQRVARLNNDGSLDTTFANIVVNNTINAIVEMNDGSYVIGGLFTTVGGVANAYLAGINSNGTLNTSFVMTKTLKMQVNTLVKMPNNSLLVGMNFQQRWQFYDGTEPLVKVNSIGQIDATFNPGTAGNITKIKLMNGKYYIFGSFGNIQGNSRSTMARLNSDLSYDPTFVLPVNGTISIIPNDVIQLSDNSYIFAGGLNDYFSTPSGWMKIETLFQMSETGYVNFNFWPSVVPSDIVYSLALSDDDGQIVVGGLFTTMKTKSVKNMARLGVKASQVQLSTGFNSAIAGEIYTVKQLANGNYLLGGASPNLSIVNENGSVLSQFNPGYKIKSTLLLSDGSILAGGGSDNSPYIYKLNASLGNLGFSFTSQYGYQNANINAMVSVPGGGFLVGGGNISYNYLTQFFKLNSDGTTDTSMTTTIGTNAYNYGEQISSIVNLPDGKYLMGGKFKSIVSSSSTNNAAKSLVRLNANFTNDPTFNPNILYTPDSYGASINSITILANGEYLLGGLINRVNGTVTYNLVKLSSGGILNSSFLPNINGEVRSVALLKNGQYLVGGIFTTVNGYSRDNIVLLNADGTVDDTFNPGINGPVNSVIQLDNGKYLIGGLFTIVGGYSRTNVVVLGPNGLYDRSTIVLSTGSIKAGGETATITLNLRDSSNNPVTDAHTITSTIATGTIGAWTYVGGGNYSATITSPNTVGSALIQIKVDAKDIPASATVNYIPNVCIPSKSIITVTPEFILADGISTGAVSVQCVDNWLNPTSLGSPVLTTSTGSIGVLNNIGLGNFTSVLTPTSTPTNVTLTLTVGSTTATKIVRFASVCEAMPKELGNCSALFGMNAKINGTGVYSLLEMPNGNIVVGGEFTSLTNNGTTTNTNGLAQISSTGTILNVVPKVGTQIYTVKSLIKSSNGEIVAAAKMNLNNGGYRDQNYFALSKYNSNLSVIPTVVTVPHDRPYVQGFANAVVQMSNGEYLMGGGYLDYYGSQLLFHKVAADGTRNPTLNSTISSSVYGYNAISPSHQIYQVQALPNQKYIVGGKFYSVTTSTPYSNLALYSLARFNSDFSRDTAFNPSLASSNGDLPMVRNISVLTGDQYLVGGLFDRTQGVVVYNLVRLNTNGTRDTSFTPTINGEVRSTLVLKNGQYLIGGSFTSINGVTRNNIALLNPDGTLDTTFNPGTNGPVNTIIQLIDGHFMVGGEFTIVGGYSRVNIAKLGLGGAFSESTIALGTSNLTVGGKTTTLTIQLKDSSNNPVLGNYSLSPRISLGTIGTLTNNGGGIYTATITSPNTVGSSDINVSISGIDLAATANITYIPDVCIPTKSIITVTPGIIIANGISTGAVSVQCVDNWLNPTSLGSPVLTSSTGSITTLNNIGLGSFTSVLTSTSTPTNVTLTLTVGSTTSTKIVRFGSECEMMPSQFGSCNALLGIGTSINGTGVYSLLEMPNGNIVVGGEFTSLTNNGTTTNTNGLAQISSTGTILNVVPKVGAQIYTVKSLIRNSNGEIVAAAKMNLNNGGYRDQNYFALSKYNSNLSVIPTVVTVPHDRPYVQGFANAVVQMSNGEYLMGGGYLDYYGSQLLFHKVAADGTRNPTLNSTINASIYGNSAIFPSQEILQILALPNQKYVVGGKFYSVATSTPYSNLAVPSLTRLNSDFSRDTSFIPSLANNDINGYNLAIIRSITALSGDKILIGGGINRADSSQGIIVVYNLLRLNNNGSIDESFIPNFNGEVRSTLVLKNGQYLIGGSFTSVNGVTRNNIALLNPDGTLDTTFNPGINGPVNTIIQLKDGNFMVGGEFTTVAGYPRVNIVKLGLAGAQLSLENSTITVSTGTIKVGGKFAGVTIQLRDIDNNPISGDFVVVPTITFGTIGSLVNLGSGAYSAVITSPSLVGSATVGFAVDAVNAASTTTINFTPDVCIPSKSIFNIAPNLLLANGVSTGAITIQCRDDWLNPTSLGSPTLSTTAGTLSAMTNPGLGNFTAVITSPSTSSTGVITFTVASNSIAASVRFGSICELVSVPQTDCSALLNLYSMTNGESWTNKSNWLTSANIASWYGVTVSGGRIWAIDLTGNNLKGVIPSTLPQLTALYRINVSNNQLTGGLSNFAPMSGLRILNGGYNQFTELPPFNIGCSLIELYMDYNLIIAEIPATINRCTQLTTLSLRNNLFNGLVPIVLSTITTLRNLWIQNNNLDRDSLNDAIIPIALPQVTSTQKNNQNDVMPPMISLPSITGSNNPSIFNLSFTINENSYLSGVVSGSAINWTGGLAVITGSNACQTIITTPVLINSGVATITLTVADDGILNGCILNVYDRALNKSNNLDIPTINADLGPLRLRLQASNGVVVSSNQVLSWTDRSPFKKRFIPVSGQPTIISTGLNGYPVMSFTPSNYLVGSGVIGAASITDLTIFAVIEDVGGSKEWYKEYGTNGSIIQTTNPGSTISTSVLNTSYVSNRRYVLRTDYTQGQQHSISLDGTNVTSASAGTYSPITNPIQTKLGGFNGKIAEIMIYSKPITTNNKEATQTYLALKYSMPLGTGVHYRKGDTTSLWNTASDMPIFARNIIGIGRDGLFGLDQLSSKSRISSVMLSAPSLTDNQYVLLGDNNGSFSRTMSGGGVSYFDRQFLVRPSSNSIVSIALPASMLGSGLISVNYELSNNSSYSTITKSGSLIFNNTDNSRVISGVNISSNQFVRLVIGNASITSQLWWDANRDGLLSASENTITTAATLGVYSCDSLTDNQVIPLGYSSTKLGTISQATNGQYKIEGLSAGKYFIRVEQGGVIDGQTQPTTYQARSASILPQMWSQHQNYRAWLADDHASQWYGGGIVELTSLSESDSDIDTNKQTSCISLTNSSNITNIGIGLYQNDTGNLKLTQALSTGSIANVQGQVISLTITVNNQSSVAADHVEVLTKLPSHFVINQLTLNSSNNTYIISGDIIKVPISSIGSNGSAQIILGLTYDGYLNTNTSVTMISSGFSLLNDSNLTDNIVQNSFMIVAGIGAGLKGGLWIDANNDSLYQSGENVTGGISVELRSCANITLTNGSSEIPEGYSGALMKATQFTSSTGLFGFDSLIPGKYYLSVPNLTFGNEFVAQHVGGIFADNNSNINPLTSMSNCFSVTGQTITAVDIGIRSVSQDVACTTTYKKKLRQGYSYDFADTLVGKPQTYKIGLITISQYESSDFNNSVQFVQYKLFNSGIRSNPLRPGQIELGFASKVVESNGTGYYVATRPGSYNSEGDYRIAYSYLACNPSIIGNCVGPSYYIKNCYQYQISSCGDGTGDIYNPNEYAGTVNRGAEECDYGADNGTTLTRNGKKCTTKCMYETDTSTADLYITKKVVRRNMCGFAEGADGLLVLPSAATGAIDIASGTAKSTIQSILVN